MQESHINGQNSDIVDIISEGAGKILGVRRIFARISPNLPEKFLGHFSCEYFLMKTVLGAISSNQSMLGVIFFRSKYVAGFF